MLDIKKGQVTKAHAQSEFLVQFFEQSEFEGTLYLGYPLFYVGSSSLTIDAMWISTQKGVVVFDLHEQVEGDIDILEVQDTLYNKVRGALIPYNQLNHKRDFAVSINVVSVIPPSNQSKVEDLVVANSDELQAVINDLEDWNYPTLFQKVKAVIQSVVELKPLIDRSGVKKPDSKGALLKDLEKTIANLDSRQESAVIEYSEGIQRIRGLAGSGKTIVLALKAAYLHASRPELNILVTYHTRALKNQFITLLELFFAQKTGRIPDRSKLKVMNAWGSAVSVGVYSEYCRINNVDYIDYRSAQSQNDRKISEFDFVCQKALESVNPENRNALFDVILIDEAQDLSESFLQLCYSMLKPNSSGNRQLIYAYDELQNLNQGYSLSNPEKIFGVGANEIILDKCYRNPKEVLTSAHALGFGIYKEGMVQFFDEPKLWSDVGYTVESGALKEHSQVTLSRAELANHKVLKTSSEAANIVEFQYFDSAQSQAMAIADDIEKNLTADELLNSDIIVINPMPLTTKREVGVIRKLLHERGIRSHIAGVSNPDVFFEDNSVTFTGINRAKGNEVAMVYLMNAQECYSHPTLPELDLRRRRNILFTAMTRSKAWLRVYGTGNRMKSLIAEFESVKENDFQLTFTYPSKEEIDNMNVIRRDLSKEEEREKIEDISVMSQMEQIIKNIKSGKSVISDYPKEFQLLIQKLIE